MAKHEKGRTNESEEYLLDFARNSNLFFTNTYFNHKKAHRTTLQGLNKIVNCKPVGIQVVYSLVRREHFEFVNDILITT